MSHCETNDSAAPGCESSHDGEYPMAHRNRRAARLRGRTLATGDGPRAPRPLPPAAPNRPLPQQPRPRPQQPDVGDLADQSDLGPDGRVIPRRR